MKNKMFIYLLLFSFGILLNPFKVSAEEITISTITGDNVNIRTSAGIDDNKLYVNDIGVQLDYGHVVDVLDEATDPELNDLCSTHTWAHIEFDYSNATRTGYVCNTYVETNTYDIIPGDEYELYLAEQGFPESYWPGLKLLHAEHPTWIFEAVQTGLDWDNTLYEESKVWSYGGKPGSRSLTSSSAEGYRSTDSDAYSWLTDTWIPGESTYWYAAHEDVVAYYMDPRNWLNEANMFMFETLSYNSSYQTRDNVTSILNGTFMNTETIKDAAMAAANDFDVSPVFLASRLKQEQGTVGNSATTGSYVSSLCTYIGYYNFFNVGAGSTNTMCNALDYAKNGTTYNRPWNTIYKSVYGGSQFAAVSYISRGQNSLYFQKFQTIPIRTLNSTGDGVTDTFGTSLYWHQYMTNISAAKSEGKITYDTYNLYGLIDNDNVALSFSIPVYNSMPASTPLPNTGNPNSYLKALTVDGASVASFEYNKKTYNLVVSAQTDSVLVAGTKINSDASVSGTGTKNLVGETTALNVTVTAENGTTTIYTINITKSEDVPITNTNVISSLSLRLTTTYLSSFVLGKSVSSLITEFDDSSDFVSATIKNKNGTVRTSGNIATGDTVTITNNGTPTTYTAVIYGDTNNDSSVSIKDLLLVQKHLRKDSTLEGVYSKAADINKDGKLDLKDLLLVQKHLLGSTQITQ